MEDQDMYEDRKMLHTSGLTLILKASNSSCTALRQLIGVHSESTNQDIPVLIVNPMLALVPVCRLLSAIIHITGKLTSRPVSSKTGYNHQAYFRWTLHVDCAFTAVQSQDGVHEMVVASGMTAPDSIAERYRARASSFSCLSMVSGHLGPSTHRRGEIL